jgi:hypothetical protein
VQLVFDPRIDALGNNGRDVTGARAKGEPVQGMKSALLPVEAGRQIRGV